MMVITSSIQSQSVIVSMMMVMVIIHSIAG